MELMIVSVIVLVSAFVVGRRLLGVMKKRGSCSGCSGTARCGSDRSSFGCAPKDATSTSPEPVRPAARRSLPILMMAATSFAVSTRASTAKAADTVETWDARAANVDFYLGTHGLGLTRSSRGVFGDIMIGYGLAERFSAYLGTILEANGRLSAGDPALYFGIFGTPIDTPHFDLDLFLDLSASGGAFSELQISPSLELNLDASDDMSTVGAFVRAGVPIYGRSAEETIGAVVELNPGLYFTVIPGHQLLVEYDMLLPLADATIDSADIGGFALGYNIVLSDALELITQASADVPSTGEPWSLGMTVGFIATIPNE